MSDKHPLFGINRSEYLHGTADVHSYRALENEVNAYAAATVLFAIGALTMFVKGAGPALDSLGQGLSLMH